MLMGHMARKLDGLVMISYSRIGELYYYSLASASDSILGNSSIYLSG